MSPADRERDVLTSLPNARPTRRREDEGRSSEAEGGGPARGLGIAAGGARA
jgi:hypothetical protein